MPGRRNYARERAAHAAQQASKQQALTDMLRSQLPTHDRALVGYDAILAYLASLGMRRRNGHRLTIRMLQRWTQRRGFPAISGTSHSRHSFQPVSTTHCVTAWMLSQFHNGHLYYVPFPKHDAAEGHFPPAVVLKRAA